MNKRARNNQPQHKSPVQAAAQQPMHMQQQVQVVHRTVFDPDSVKVYESLTPGAAERLLTILEKNNESEREARTVALRVEEHAATAHSKDNRRRDWMAFLLIISSLAFSGVFAYIDLPWLSGATFVSMIGYIALGFFKWRNNA